MSFLYFQKLGLTERQIGLLAELTKSQRLSPYWYMFRKGRLTASNFGKVIAAVQRNSFPPSLFKSLMGEYNLEGAKSVQWGIAHEQDAVDSYKNHPICPSTEIVESGLYLDSSGTPTCACMIYRSNLPSLFIIAER